MSLHVVASVVLVATLLTVLLVVVPVVVLLRDLRSGRPDPGWSERGAA